MLNKSYSYLVPLLNEKCKVDSDFVILMKNTYTYHYDYPQEEMIVLCYETSDTDLFRQYLDSFLESELFKEMLYEDEFVYVVLYFPLEFIKEYRLYKLGKFSHIPEESKTIILNYILDIHSIRSANRVRRVLYKDEELRFELEKKLDLKIDPSLELSSKPNRVQETFILIKK